MVALLFVVIAVAVRLLPHPFHFTPVGAALLYFGARRPVRQLVFPVALLIASDIYLTQVRYGYPFHASDYFWTWAWYAGICLLGGLLRENAGWPRITAAALTTSVSFFLITNFSVWLGGTLYPHTVAGLVACYINAIPFFRNTLASDFCFTLIAFGLPALLGRVTDASPAERGTKVQKPSTEVLGFQS